MVYRFKYDDNDDSSKPDITTIVDGPGKEKASAANTTTTTTTASSSSSGGFLEMAKTVAVVGGTALVAGWSLYCLLSSDPSPDPSSSSEKEKKKMKAPGKNGEYQFRQPFEDNPRAYFKDLRNSKRRG